MKARVGLGHETPVAFAPEIQRPLARLGQAGDVIGAARLEQQYLHLGIFSQPASEYRPRLPGTAHDDVVTRFQHSIHEWLLNPSWI